MDTEPVAGADGPTDDAAELAAERSVVEYLRKLERTAHITAETIGPVLEVVPPEEKVKQRRASIRGDRLARQMDRALVRTMPGEHGTIGGNNNDYGTTPYPAHKGWGSVSVTPGGWHGRRREVAVPMLDPDRCPIEERATRRPVVTGRDGATPARRLTKNERRALRRARAAAERAAAE